jgi:hypothetical protein
MDVYTPKKKQNGQKSRPLGPYEKSLSLIAGGFLRPITLTVLPLGGIEHRTLRF